MQIVLQRKLDIKAVNLIIHIKRKEMKTQSLEPLIQLDWS